MIRYYGYSWCVCRCWNRWQWQATIFISFFFIVCLLLSSILFLLLFFFHSFVRLFATFFLFASHIRWFLFFWPYYIMAPFSLCLFIRCNKNSFHSSFLIIINHEKHQWWWCEYYEWNRIKSNRKKIDDKLMKSNISSSILIKLINWENLPINQVFFQIIIEFYWMNPVSNTQRYMFLKNFIHFHT